MGKALALPSSSGGFACIAQVVLEFPSHGLVPRDDLRSSRGVYWCEHFWKGVLPSLDVKVTEKAPKEGVEPAVPAASVFFWKCDQQLMKYDDLARRFPGKEKPVPWWGLSALLHRHHYDAAAMPFSLTVNQLVTFMPLRPPEVKKPADVVLVRARGRVSTTPTPEWWVDHIEKSDNSLEWPVGSLYLSWQLH